MNIEEILKKEVGDFADLHDWDNSCNASALYTGFHMVNVAMDKIKELQKENKEQESEIKDYRTRLGLRV